MNRKAASPLIGQIALFAMLVVVLAYAFYEGSRQRHVLPNVCPIDGHPAEWSKRVGQHDCEYSHHSNLERKTHSWTDRCP
jgi:hypothetical protein